MTKLAALGDGPIAFFNNGAQLEVPLSAVYFENDVARTTRTDLPSPEFGNWINFLVSRGRLVADVAPPPVEAIVATAVAPGTSGNTIQLMIEPNAANPASVDVTATETDTYEGVTLDLLVAQLGIDGDTPGTRPGLLNIKSPYPANPADPDGTVTLSGTPPIWKIAGTGTTTAVKLQPRRPGTGTLLDAGDFQVSINIPAPAGGAATGATFTLSVVWKKKALGVDLGNISTKLADLGYVVTFTAPDETQNFTMLPRPGKVTLTGGSEPVDAKAASAKVMANE